MSKRNSNAYWRANIRLVVVLLAVWFIAGYVISILVIEQANTISIGELGLGFWMAQQGSIYVFVLLVLIYALGMDRIDRTHGMGD